MTHISAESIRDFKLSTRAFIPLLIIVFLMALGAVLFFSKDRARRGIADALQQNANQVAHPTAREDEIKLRIRIGETAFAFGDKVQITVNKIQIDEVRSNYKVFATVIFPNDEKVRISNAEVNYKLSYPKEAAYEMEILDITEASVYVYLRKITKVSER